jgi:hypothetical protein
MVKLAAPAYLPPREADRPALDVSWTFSVSRVPGSDELAARMTRAALDTLGGPYRAVGALLTDATSLACAYLVAHSAARRYRVTLGVDGGHCAVAVTDYGYDHGPLPGDTGDPVPEPDRDAARDLCRRLAESTAYAAAGTGPGAAAGSATGPGSAAGTAAGAASGTAAGSGTEAGAGAEGPGAAPAPGAPTVDGVQVHHAVDGAVLVRFRAQCPAPAAPPPAPPAAPDASRDPGARG